MGSTNAKKTRSERGATTFEAVFALPIFLFLLFNGMNVVIGMYKALAIENLLARTARQAILVAHAGDPVNAIKNRAIEIGAAYSVQLDAENIRVCPALDGACINNEPGSSEGAGGSEEFVSINITQSIPIVMGVAYEYSYSVIARNEPFL